MTEAIIILALIALGAAVFGTLRNLHDDGYGHRPPPASHFPDLFEPRTGSHAR